MTKPLHQDSIRHNGPLFYATMSFTFACCFACVLYLYAFPVFAVMAIPLVCLTMCWSRSIFIGAVMFGSIFLSLSVLGVTGQSTMGSIEQSLVALLTLCFLANSARYLARTERSVEFVMTSRINYTPVTELTPSHKSKAMIGDAISLVFIVLAWLCADVLTSHFGQIAVSQRKYQEYVVKLRQSVGLELPEIFIAIQLLFAFMLAVWIANQVFSYWRVRNNSGGIAAMHLRTELWKWNGSEQRMVSKQGRKNRGF